MFEVLSLAHYGLAPQVQGLSHEKNKHSNQALRHLSLTTVKLPVKFK
jgi:hypothetical protein